MSAPGNNEEPELVILRPKEHMYFPEDMECARLLVEWFSKQQGIICDLDLTLYLYDERARLIEKIDAQNKVSKDASCLLIKEIDASDASNGRMECFKFDTRIVNSSTSAVLMFLDGGPRNFQFLQSVSIKGNRIPADRSYGDFLPTEDASTGKNGPLFKISARTRKNYQGMALCVLYKEGWNESTNTPRWAVKSIAEPLFVTSSKDKVDQCGMMVVGAVPALDKFRPRLFSSITDICAALSSHSLPKLKKKFQKGDGLPIGQFTEVLFKQLFETHPKIVEDTEAPYAVAMLQEMFHQIDYNGDGTTNWDEFTSFCVQTGLSVATGKAPGAKNFSLEQYIIEYGEAQLERDRVLSAYRYISLMRYVPESHKILVIPEDADNVMIFDEKFRVHAQLYPSKVQIIGKFTKTETGDGKEKAVGNKTGGAFPRVIIYDIIYMGGREMYCYSSSDHCITVCKEFSSMGGKKVNYQQHNRFYHTLLHLKLCWSTKHDLLCSVASDRVIYGWNIDSGNIIFQVSRHTDIITDFIAVEHLDMFMTCSMDKRIVLWSAVSRRVKGILLGHKRGVRGLSVFEQLLLSSGFECEARLWELVNKDCIGILKGHRHPIVCAKLMCDRAQTEKEHRAITVDESGEFRLWNIYVRERSSEPVNLPTLQIFEMTHPETPINQFRFLAVPFNPASSTSYYSDIIACSTKLLHFLPEKNVKEFVPPSACAFNDSGSSVMTTFGKTVIIYDVSTGSFSNVFEDITLSDISSMCLDGERGRKFYLGNAAGELLLVNATTGVIIDQVHYHTKEISSLCGKNKGGRSCVYSASMDGHLRLYEENNSKIHLHHSLENAFGVGTGITCVKSAPSLNLLVATSAGKQWGVFHDTSMKKLFVVHQDEVVTAFEILGASKDKQEEEHRLGMKYTPAQLFNLDKDTLLTVVLAMPSGVVVYTVCVEECRGVKTFELLHNQQMYITDLSNLKSPDQHSVNYSQVRSGQHGRTGYQLVGVTDDGIVLVWDTSVLRFESEAKYREHYAHVPRRSQLIVRTEESRERERKQKQLQAEAVAAAEAARKANGEEEDAETAHSLHSHHSHDKTAKMGARERRKTHGKYHYHASGGMHSQHEDDTHHAHHSHPHHESSSHHPHHPHHHPDGHHSHASHHDPHFHPHQKHHPHADDHPAHGHEHHGPHGQHGHGHHGHDSHHPHHHGHGAGAAPGSRPNSRASGGGGGGDHHAPHPHHNPHHPHAHALAAGRHSDAHAHDSSHDPHNPHHGHHGHGDHHGHHGHGDHHGGHHHHGHHHGHGHHGHGGHHHHGSHVVKPKLKKKGTSTTNWVEMHCDQMFPIPKGKKFPAYIKTSNSWFAHHDSVPIVVPMHAHGCLLTVSHDGYHRIWNLDKQCLGELILPNLTEQMKANTMCKEPGSNWRFIMERIPVTQHHLDIAQVLVKFLKQTRQEKMAEAAAESRRAHLSMIPVGFKGFRDTSMDEIIVGGGAAGMFGERGMDEGALNEHAQAELRSSVLKSLVEPPKPSEDLPPARLPTKEEKELIKLSLTLERVNRHGSEGDGTGGAPSNLSSLVLGEEGTSSFTELPKQSIASPSRKQSTNASPPRTQSRGGGGGAALGRSGSKPNSRGGTGPGGGAASLNSSAIFGNDSSVLMSAFGGGPSLWTVPGERDIFGNSATVTHANVPEVMVPPAFSEASLKSLRRDNMIDIEGHQILRKLAASTDRVQVYDRSQPTLLVRNPAMSTSVSLPALDSMRRTEIAFGAQKDMYKNAEKLLNDRDNISKSQVRNAVAKARIDQNVRKINSMIHLIQPPTHDEVILPKTKGASEGGGNSTLDGDELQKLRSEEQKMKIRLLKSAALVPMEAQRRALDPVSIDRWVSRMNAAIEPFGDNKVKEEGKKRKKKEQLSQAAIHVVEKKLQQAIRGEYRARMAATRRLPTSGAEAGNTAGGGGEGAAGKDGKAGGGGSGTAPGTAAGASGSGLADSNASASATAAGDPWADDDEDEDSDEDAPDGKKSAPSSTVQAILNACIAEKKPVLTTRMLLPYYKLESVHQFMDIFAKVDENFSGDLDVNEWIRLFTSLNESVPVLEARMIFMKIDKDSDGYLTMRELIPVVFNKATAEQKRAIITYAEMELTKKIECEIIPKVTHADLEFLFEAYDTENIGFVDVAFVKERVRLMYLSEQALFHFMDSISDIEDDEMVSMVEFKRLFRLYTMNPRG